MRLNVDGNDLNLFVMKIVKILILNTVVCIVFLSKTGSEPCMSFCQFVLLEIPAF